MKDKQLLIVASRQHWFHKVIQWQKVLRKQNTELAKKKKILKKGRNQDDHARQDTKQELDPKFKEGHAGEHVVFQ